MRIPYTWKGRTCYVEASAGEDVGWLRSKISEELGLPAWPGLRLKCGTRDLRDGKAVSTIGGATVHVQWGGGLAGGAANEQADPEERNGLSEKSLAVAKAPTELLIRQREADRTKRAREDARSSKAMLHRHRPAAGSSSGGGASKRPKANPGRRSSIDESNSGAGGSEGEAGGQGGSSGGSPSSVSPA